MSETTRHYPETASSPDFPKLEESIQQFWQENHLFERSVENRPGEQEGENNAFVFYDGPPFANGLPHYGHLLTGFVKDVVARYQTMRGKRVERRFGWDCHGLPAEMAAEKELGVSGRAQITEFGIEKFNQHCQTSVLKYTEEWKDYVTRQARWVDFENDYKTMDRSYMESVMWAFKQLHEKGLIYESMRVMPYSWACETPLSNFETRLDNAYRERADKAVTVAFTLKEKPQGAPEGLASYKLLAWTTTPWTLPSNLALAVGEGIEYACVVREDTCYILAASSVKTYKKALKVQDDETFEAIPGSSLAGLAYEPLLPFFKDQENAFRVLSGEFVIEGDGTGCVHLAPGFGEDDFNLCQEEGINLVCPVDSAGKFTAEVSDYQGLQVFDANELIIRRLKEEGSWIQTDQYLHNYPHCWRTDTPLIYKAVPSWYVKVTEFKDRMVELNQQINWIPGHVKDGLFGKWLENARDWSISRNRFWGAPIPVWRSDNPKNQKLYVYGSIEELEKDFGVKLDDLHKPVIDTLTRPDPEDSNYTLRRVPDVFDCWFESGSMPYAQVHYPFENKEWFENHFPADFIVEYTAQTRGWFYTLMVLSTALFDRPPFLNCICHGVILDEHGQKLSKRLNNYADPRELFATYGADALRWLMMASPVMRGQELLIDKGAMVKDVLRLSVKPIWNAYHFFTLYANSDEIKANFSVDSKELMDRYILAKVRETVLDVQKAMDAYDMASATAAVEAFFEVLNNWYIRRNRHRFWRADKNADKQDAYNTLYTVLHIMCRVAAPLLPMLTEEMYLGLEAGGKKNPDASVHLADYPDVSAIAEEAELIADMERIRDACNAALAIRNAQNIRIRQPLAGIKLVGLSDKPLNPALLELVYDEVNVKAYEAVSPEHIPDYATYKLQMNFPLLGKRLPAKMKDIIAASKQGKWERSGDKIMLAGEVLEPAECSLKLEPKDPTSMQPLSTHDALVVLDVDITEDLRAEGLARDIVRLIQQARKDADLDISDRINLKLDAAEPIGQAVDVHREYITEQTLSLSLVIENQVDARYVSEGELDGEKIVIGFDVAA